MLKTDFVLLVQNETQPKDDESTHGHRFPYTVVMIVSIWIILGICYAYARWKQRPKATYMIPRVFVLCSPRTVQFHYELILRVGLPSYDFNPDKHDIDLTVMGQQKNEVVPMTRLNTRTLIDEPLITTLSIVAYRLVEMPSLASIMVKHSGPYKAWLYAYDFTIIDLSNNKEQYYTLNHYIGSLHRDIKLDAPNNTLSNVNYPIDDVPLPQWTLEDIYLVIFTAMNYIMLSITTMPINCSYAQDIAFVMLTGFGGGAMVFFLDWLLYYHLRWSQERREYFNINSSCLYPGETFIRTVIAIAALSIGGLSIYYALSVMTFKGALVWLLATTNCLTLVIGFWNVSRIAELGETIVSYGLHLRGIETVSIGMKYSELVDMHTNSGSAASQDSFQSNLSNASRVAQSNQSIGPRSSVKSFGFDPIKGHLSRKITSNIHSNSEASKPHASNIGAMKAPTSTIKKTMANLPAINSVSVSNSKSESHEKSDSDKRKRHNQQQTNSKGKDK